MFKVIVPALCLTAALAGPACAAGKVEVTYFEPDKFSDIGFGAFDRERTLRQMTMLLEAFATKLPDGQTLKIEVTDIDLAGEQRQGRAQNLRILRGMADWPRVKLRYTLLAGSGTVSSGEADVYDLGYQYSAVNAIGTNLPYERRMLRKWFNQTIAPLRVSQSLP